MATLLDAAEMAQDPRLIAPLTAAVVKAAINIVNEDPETDDHGYRVTLAQRVLHEPEVYARRFSWAVSTNTTVVDKWVDDDIEGAVGDFQFVVDSVWDALADIPPAVPA